MTGDQTMIPAGDCAAPRGKIVVCVVISDPVLATRMFSLLSGDSRLKVRLGLDDGHDSHVILADRLPASLRPTIIIDDHHHDERDLGRWGDDVRAVLPSTVDEDLLRAAVMMVAAGFTIVGADGPRGFSDEDAEPARLSDIGNDEMTLTPRETAVLSLLAHGASNKVVARELEISVHTAKFHVASVLARLKARNRSDAVAIGIRRGLILL